MLTFVTWKWESQGERKSEFSNEHVNILYNMLNRNLKMDFKLVCISDDFSGIREEVNKFPIWKDALNLPGELKRLRIFGSDVLDSIGDNIVNIDLDVVIVNDITPLFIHNSSFKMWFLEGGPLNASLFQFKAGEFDWIWNNFQHEELIEKYVRMSFFRKLLTPKSRRRKCKVSKSAHMAGFQRGTEQAWIAYCLWPLFKNNDEKIDIWTCKDGIYNWGQLKRRILPHKKLPDDAKMVFFCGPDNPPNLKQDVHWINQYYN